MNFNPNTFNRKLSKLGLVPKNGRVDLVGLQSARTSRELAAQAQQWCQEKFGDNWIWSSPTQTEYTEFYFANTQDALLFKLTFNTA